MGCKYAAPIPNPSRVRISKAPKDVTQSIDDEFLVIVALRMAADHTEREDLRPHYLRLAEDRERSRFDDEQRNVRSHERQSR